MDYNSSKPRKSKKMLEAELAKKKATFAAMSEEYFQVNQDFTQQFLKLKRIRKDIVKHKKSYIENMMTVAQHEAELRYQKHLRNMNNEAKMDYFSMDMEEQVARCRGILEDELSALSNCKKTIKLAQAPIASRTDETRIKLLNLATFCRYAHTATEREATKLVDHIHSTGSHSSYPNVWDSGTGAGTEAAAIMPTNFGYNVSGEHQDGSSNYCNKTRWPSKKEYAAASKLNSKRLLASRRALRKFYRAKLGELRRYEHILMGREKEVIERYGLKTISASYGYGGKIDTNELMKIAMLQEMKRDTATASAAAAAEAAARGAGRGLYGGDGRPPPTFTDRGNGLYNSSNFQRPYGGSELDSTGAGDTDADIVSSSGHHAPAIVSNSSVFQRLLHVQGLDDAQNQHDTAGETWEDSIEYLEETNPCRGGRSSGTTDGRRKYSSARRRSSAMGKNRKISARKRSSAVGFGYDLVKNPVRSFNLRGNVNTHTAGGTGPGGTLIRPVADDKLPFLNARVATDSVSAMRKDPFTSLNALSPPRERTLLPLILSPSSDAAANRGARPAAGGGGGGGAVLGRSFSEEEEGERKASETFTNGRDHSARTINITVRPVKRGRKARKPLKRHHRVKGLRATAGTYSGRSGSGSGSDSESDLRGWEEDRELREEARKVFDPMQFLTTMKAPKPDHFLGHSNNHHQGRRHTRNGSGASGTISGAFDRDGSGSGGDRHNVGKIFSGTDVRSVRVAEDISDAILSDTFNVDYDAVVAAAAGAAKGSRSATLSNRRKRGDHGVGDDQHESSRYGAHLSYTPHLSTATADSSDGHLSPPISPTSAAVGKEGKHTHTRVCARSHSPTNDHKHEQIHTFSPPHKPDRRREDIRSNFRDRETPGLYPKSRGMSKIESAIEAQMLLQQPRMLLCANGQKADAYDSVLSRYVVQLARLEGKHKELRGMKEGLDLHLTKQSYLLLLLMRDLDTSFENQLNEARQMCAQRAHSATERSADAFSSAVAGKPFIPKPHSVDSKAEDLQDVARVPTFDLCGSNDSKNNLDGVKLSSSSRQGSVESHDVDQRANGGVSLGHQVERELNGSLRGEDSVRGKTAESTAGSTAGGRGPAGDIFEEGHLSQIPSGEENNTHKLLAESASNVHSTGVDHSSIPASGMPRFVRPISLNLVQKSMDRRLPNRDRLLDQQESSAVKHRYYLPHAGRGTESLSTIQRDYELKEQLLAGLSEELRGLLEV